MRCFTNWQVCLVGMLVGLAQLLLTPVARAGSGTIDSNGVLSLDYQFRYFPDETHLAQAQRDLQRASAILCDATDGQVRIGNVKFSQSFDL